MLTSTRAFTKCIFIQLCGGNDCLTVMFKIALVDHCWELLCKYVVC